uniref:Uncharacterized protein n=1 Tax=Cucumis melo TaxID=3656 RepID=A0A9I9EEM5_CUCME
MMISRVWTHLLVGPGLGPICLLDLDLGPLFGGLGLGLTCLMGSTHFFAQFL